MKVFLSALENAAASGTGQQLAHYMADKGIRFKYNLMSYFYARKKPELTEFIRDHSELVMIDSGAHSFQKGLHVDWEAYTDQYAEFIQRFDRPHVVGYFEMDVDNVIGYERVLRLRSRLEAVSDKIIPVWHKGRGIHEFKRMCEDYAGRIVAVTGFKNEDIQDHQYMMFLKYAWDHGCQVHCLGMTRKKILDSVPFDYVDSSSWLQQSLYGKIAGEPTKVSQVTSRARREVVFTQNYLAGIRMQKHYEQRWQHYEK